jgi:protein-S-isoprenylcysteine O-methyltransferase Ste14
MKTEWQADGPKGRVGRHRLQPPRATGLTRFISAVLLIGLPVAARLVAPRPVLIPTPYNFAGVIVLLAGCGLAIWAWRLFQERGTTLQLNEASSALITTGPFRFSRNPMYLGALIAVFGLCICLGATSSFVFPVIYAVAIDRFMILPEERLMARQFGAAYFDYRRRVRRWL